MHEQSLLSFGGDNHGTINLYSQTGKNIAEANCRIDPDLKSWLVEVSDTISAATGNPKYGVSSVIREAILFYKMFFSVRRKLIQQRKKVIAMLDIL